MGESGNRGLVEDVAAALSWWREAGVDGCFLDEPADWLAGREAARAPKPGATAGEQSPPTPGAGGDRAPDRGAPASRAPGGSDGAPIPLFASESLPRSLADFADWWLTEPLLDAGRITGRVPPRGEAGAELMVVVPEPEPEDEERLLSGPRGRLIDAMLAAMGLAPERVYLASALARHTPMPDWSALARSHGAVLRRHIALAAPRRLVVFGNNALSLLGNAPPNSGQIFTQFEHGTCKVPLWAAADLAVLLARPRGKAGLWQQWLDWSSS